MEMCIIIIMLAGKSVSLLCTPNPGMLNYAKLA